MKFNKLLALITGVILIFSVTAVGCVKTDEDNEPKLPLELYYSLDEEGGNIAKDSASGKKYTINSPPRTI